MHPDLHDPRIGPIDAIRGCTPIFTIRGSEAINTIRGCTPMFTIGGSRS
jgi:hypothetical protein